MRKKRNVKRFKKLELQRETLRQLDGAKLNRINGGSGSQDMNCSQRMCLITLICPG